MKEIIPRAPTLKIHLCGCRCLATFLWIQVAEGPWLVRIHCQGRKANIFLIIKKWCKAFALRIDITNKWLQVLIKEGLKMTQVRKLIGYFCDKPGGSWWQPAWRKWHSGWKWIAGFKIQWGAGMKGTHLWKMKKREESRLEMGRLVWAQDGWDRWDEWKAILWDRKEKE